MSTDTPIVWYGGMGHKLLSMDPIEPGEPGGDQCYRCGMAAEPMDTEHERLIPDCAGPDAGQEHHWTVAYVKGGAAAIECAYGCTTLTADSVFTIPRHAERPLSRCHAYDPWAGWPYSPGS